MWTFATEQLRGHGVVGGGKENNNRVDMTHALVQRVATSMSSAFQGVMSETLAQRAHRRTENIVARIRAKKIANTNNLCVRCYVLRPLICELWLIRLMFSHSYLSVVTRFDQTRDQRMRLVVMLSVLFGAMFVASFLSAAVNPDRTQYREITWEETLLFALVSSAMQLPVRVLFEYLTRKAGAASFRLRYFPLWREVQIRKAVEKRVVSRLAAIRTQLLARPAVVQAVLSETEQIQRFRELLEEGKDDLEKKKEAEKDGNNKLGSLELQSMEENSVLEDDGRGAGIAIVGEERRRQQVALPPPGYMADEIPEDPDMDPLPPGATMNREMASRESGSVHGEAVPTMPPPLPPTWSELIVAESAAANLANRVRRNSVFSGSRSRRESGTAAAPIENVYEVEEDPSRTELDMVQLGNLLTRGKRLECIGCKWRWSVDPVQFCDRSRIASKLLAFPSRAEKDPLDRFTVEDEDMSGWIDPPQRCQRFCPCVLWCFGRHAFQKLIHLRTWRAAHGRPHGACWCGPPDDVDVFALDENRDVNGDGVDHVDTTNDGGFAMSGGDETGFASLLVAAAEFLSDRLSCSCRRRESQRDNASSLEHVEVTSEEAARAVRRQIDQLLDDEDLRKVERRTLELAPRHTCEDYRAILFTYFSVAVFLAAVVYYEILFGLYHGDEVTLNAQASFWISQAISVGVIQPGFLLMVTIYAVVLAPVGSYWFGWCPCCRAGAYGTEGGGLLSGRLQSVSFVQAAGAASGLDPERAILAYGVFGAIATAMSAATKNREEEDDEDILEEGEEELPNEEGGLQPISRSKRERAIRELTGRKALQARLLREYVLRRYRSVVTRIGNERGQKALDEIRALLSKQTNEERNEEEPEENEVNIRRELLPADIRSTLATFGQVARAHVLVRQKTSPMSKVTRVTSRDVPMIDDTDN